MLSSLPLAGVFPSVLGYWNIDVEHCQPFQTTINQMVMDKGSQQTPSDIWHPCQHVSVLLLCSGKPHNPPHVCQISHSARALIYQHKHTSTHTHNKHTHLHIHTNAHPHRLTRIQNGLIVIQAIMVVFSHAAKTTVKTHSNRLWLHHMMSQYLRLGETCGWQGASVVTAAQRPHKFQYSFVFLR